jgi:hypothetical protein
VVPTPPAFAPPLEVLAGTWRTWNIRSGSQFLPDPPPAFGGKAYAREVAEVYKVSRSLTDEQKQIANFWADVPGTVTPTGHWNQIALELIRGHRLSAPAAARVLAALNTAQADAFIACWNAKFTYWSERPVTAIRRELDPSWLSYIGTPPFPSYVSGHSSTSGAASRVLAAYFRDAGRSSVRGPRRLPSHASTAASTSAVTTRPASSSEERSRRRPSRATSPGRPCGADIRARLVSGS